mmetsp:Transcript_15879/g.25904  ORF Transcript_15879/g.25904 Transcript_15879/m.25904 type:complete len:315 (-) Transcript_15879:170-1114(-)
METQNHAEGDVPPGNKEMDIEKNGNKDTNPSPPAVEEGGDLKIVKSTALENAASEELSSGRMAVLLFIASAIVMIDASVECHNADNCSDERAYAVAVGTVSTVVAFVFVYVKLFKSELYQSTRLVWALSFFVWWSAGVAVLTFRGPFLATGNGYFATWLSWFSSARLLYADVPFIQRKIQALLTMEDSNLQTLFLILLTSIVELAAAGVACHNSSNCNNQTAFAVAIGAISILWVLPFMILSSLDLFELYGSSLLACFWIVGAGVLTFDQPFSFTGNGFFSTWIATLGSCYWFYLCFQDAHGSQVGDVNKPTIT